MKLKYREYYGKLMKLKENVFDSFRAMRFVNSNKECWFHLGHRRGAHDGKEN